MILPDEAVKEFIEIYKKEFGETLGMKVGRDKAQRLFNFCKIVLKPPLKEEENKSKNIKPDEK